MFNPNFKKEGATMISNHEKSSGITVSGAEDALQKSLECENKNITHLLEAVIESIAGYHWWKDKNGRYMGCNKTLALSADLNSPKDIIGKTDYDMPWSKQADELTKNDDQVIKSGVSLNFEETFTTRNGKTLTFSVIKVPLRDERGTIIGTIGSSVDITQQKNMILKLAYDKQQSEIDNQAKLESIINSIAGNHWWKDLSGRYRSCNEELLKSIGLAAEDIIGKTDYELMDAAQAELLVKNDLEVIASGLPHRHEEQITLQDGKVLTFLVTKVPFKDHDGNIIGTIGNSFDITAQKNALTQIKIAKEQAENANRIKSDFIANMSHDLRTPLAGILGLASILERRIDVEEKDLMHSIVQSSKVLLNLFNEIIEYIQIESGNLPSQNIQFEIRSVLSEVVELVTPCIKDKGLNLIITIDKDVPTYLVGDKLRIHRIILNLVSNAIKFSEAGNIKITFQISKREDANIELKATVEDNGIGIPEDQLDQIFTRFTRLNSAYDGVFKGVGLGLSIVKQFINDLRGNIFVESQVGIGSKFTCIVPFQAVCLDDAQLDNKNTEPLTESNVHIMDANHMHCGNYGKDLPQIINNNSSSFSVLLVEDDLLAQKIAKLVFEELGCHVDIANTGGQAVGKAEKNSYSLILMDVGLPDINGCEATKKIKLFDKKAGRFTPIVALTAHADIQNKEQCILSGMEAVLAKPIQSFMARGLIEQYSQITFGDKL